MENHYRVHSERVIAQIVDGQAILIQPSSGCYYSLNESGTFAWERLAAGMSAQEAAKALREAYGCGDTSDDVDRFLQELLTENLLVAATEPCNFSGTVGATSEPYSAPALEAFRDLGDLLALDPPAPGLAQVSWQGL